MCHPAIGFPATMGCHPSFPAATGVSAVQGGTGSPSGEGREDVWLQFETESTCTFFRKLSGVPCYSLYTPLQIIH